MVGLSVSHCICVVACVSVGTVRFLGSARAAGVRYVERIIVVAGGPMLVFVHDCCVPSVLFFCCVRHLRLCVFGFHCR